jgi:hypothetical protein
MAETDIAYGYISSFEKPEHPQQSFQATVTTLFADLQINMNHHQHEKGAAKGKTGTLGPPYTETRPRPLGSSTPIWFRRWSRMQLSSGTHAAVRCVRAVAAACLTRDQASFFFFFQEQIAFFHSVSLKKKAKKNSGCAGLLDPPWGSRPLGSKIKKKPARDGNLSSNSWG